jgi:hypothetical protein
MKVTGRYKTKSERRLLLSENILPMQKAGNWVYQRRRWLSGTIRTRIQIFWSATDKQMIPHIQYNGKTIVLWLIY